MMQREFYAKQKGAGLTRLPAFELVFRRLPWTSSGSSHWDNPFGLSDYSAASAITSTDTYLRPSLPE